MMEFVRFFIPIPNQSCVSPLVTLRENKLLFRFVPRTIELETVLCRPLKNQDDIIVQEARGQIQGRERDNFSQMPPRKRLAAKERAGLRTVATDRPHTITTIRGR
jgi:hypothetical protein